MSERPQRRLNPSRTRPHVRRRTPAPPDPERDRRERKRLGRAVLITGTLVAISVMAVALITRSERASAPVPVAALHAANPAAFTLVDVRDVIDGDTLDVDAGALPFRVRLFGVDAPERGERCAGEATNRLTTLAGDAVRLRADERQQDRFGRELRYLYTSDGASIDATLIAEGLALAWRADGALRDELVALEQEARDAHHGCLWENG